MNLRGQKYRKMHFLRKLLAMFYLVATCGVEASVESMPPASQFWVASGDSVTRYSSFEAAYLAWGILWGSQPDVVSWAPQGTVNPNHAWDSYYCSVPSGFTYIRATGSYVLVHANGHLSSAGTFFCAVAICPIPAEVSSSSYIYNLATGMCERPSICPDTVPPSYYNATKGRCEQRESFTITLTGGNEVEPSSSSSIKSLPIIATIKDQSTGQPPITPVNVKVSLKVDPTSGGHDHGDSTRPRGGIDDVGKCLSDDTCKEWTLPANNGVVEFNFKAPEASGKHTITATCVGCTNTATKPVDVKVDGLEPIPAFPYYALDEVDSDHPGQTKVIGATTLHGDNHNLLPAAAQVLMQIAVKYRFDPKLKVQDWQTNKMVPPPPLHVNDASLKWGGKFDIKGQWTGSHKEHRRGTSVDLRANEKVGAIPPELFEEFEQKLVETIAGDKTKRKFLRECTPNEKPSEANPSPVQHNRIPENYCVSQVDGSLDTNRHYHVRLLGE